MFVTFLINHYLTLVEYFIQIPYVRKTKNLVYPGHLLPPYNYTIVHNVLINVVLKIYNRFNQVSVIRIREF